MEGFKNVIITIVIALLLPMITGLAVDAAVPAPHKHRQTVYERFVDDHSGEQAYKDEKHLVANTYFYTSLVGGLIAIVAGIWISIASIGSGFIAGGFLMIFTAYASDWTTLTALENLIGLVLTLVLLIAVVWFRQRRKAQH